MALNKYCFLCEGSGVITKVKLEYISFGMCPQYEADPFMCEKVPCPMCILEQDIYWLGDEDKKEDL